MIWLIATLALQALAVGLALYSWADLKTSRLTCASTTATPGVSLPSCAPGVAAPFKEQSRPGGSGTAQTREETS